MRDTRKKNTDNRDTLIVNDFVDIFLKVLPGLQPGREVFGIEIVLGTSLISKDLYRMGPLQMK